MRTNSVLLSFTGFSTVISPSSKLVFFGFSTIIYQSSKLVFFGFSINSMPKLSNLEFWGFSSQNELEAAIINYQIN
jgi:hypothetical protein